MEDKKKPGVMLYFEDLRPVEDMPDDVAGQLFKAILSYSETGAEPIVSPVLQFAWRFIRKGIDEDTKNYYLKIEQRKYAAYCKSVKAAGREPLPFQLWLAEQRPITTDNDRSVSFNEPQRNDPITNNQLPITNNQLPITNNHASHGVDVDAAWGEFWDEYPKHSCEAAARIAFAKAMKFVSPERLMAALRSWKASDQWTKESGRFVPLPANWLDRHGWEENPPRRRDGVAQHGDELTSVERAAVQRALAEGARIAEEDARLGQGGNC